jgi:sugar-specific transcriptional regulator TrmB
MISTTLLEEIGLTQAESRVYLAAAQLGESLHKTLADRAQVKRSTLYEMLPGLIEKGLITESVRGKRKFLVAQDLQGYLEDRKARLEKVESIVPQLRALLATATSKPRLLLYEGVEGVKKVWYDHLLQKQEVLEVVGTENIQPELQKYLKQYYIIERTRRRISTKMLISGPAVAGILNTKTDPYELREVKAMDGKLFPIPVALDIYGDNVSITLHRADSEPIGLIIRSQEIATTLRSLFNFIWNKS